MGSRKYGAKWKRIRNSYIAQHPNCELCLSKMIATPATEVHHIVPLCRGGDSKPYNLMALCTECHRNIHKKENE